VYASFINPGALPWDTKGVGQDGKQYELIIGWDPERAVFCGPSGITYEGNPVYQVDLAVSKAFEPTDITSLLSRGGPALASNTAEVDLERVFETIRQRQARVKTISYTWTSKQVIPKGSMTVADPATGLPVRSDLPAEDTEIERTHTLVIDGHYVRYDDEGLVWFEGRGTGEFISAAGTIVLGADGVERHLDRFQDSRPGGLIDALRHIPAGVEYQAVLQAYRLTDSVLGRISPREVRFAGRAELRGHPCILVEKREEVFQPPMTKRWWLAEDMGYGVLRWEEKRDTGEHLVQLDMDYKADQQVGWQLTSWSLTTWGGAHGEPLTRTNVATEVHINEPVAPATFQITFPPGTRVSDGLRGGQYVVGSQPVTYPAGAPEGEMSFEERVLRVKLRWRVPFFNFTDVSLDEVLKFIRAVAGIDVVLAPQVQEERDRLKVTMLVQDTSTEEALNYITTALNLEWSVRDGSVHVSPKTKLTAAAAIGEPAPELVLEEGAGVTLEQSRGKPVVVAFVTIYSRPSVKVLDDLKALQAEKGADKLAVLAVHDRTATPEEIEQFRKDHGIPFPILRVPAAPRDGWDSATFQAYKVTALPTVVRVDAEGKVESVGANVP
jgi:peroxiredoxin